MSEEQKKPKRAAPCTKWMHHKWLPAKKDFSLVVPPPGGVAEVEQICTFCGDKRMLVLADDREESEKE